MDMRLWATNPFTTTKFVRGKQSSVWDARGKKYLDLQSGTWCNVLGQARPELVHAINKQLKKLTHTGSAFGSEEMDAALKKLSEILPAQLSRAVFLNTGSEAVELALKMARKAAGAGSLAVVEKGYYGATGHAFAISEAGRFAGYMETPHNVHILPAPDCKACPMKRMPFCNGEFPCLDGLAQLAQDKEQRLSAIIYEPVMCAGGIIVPPIGYGARLRALATKCGALLIAEEVTTGIGRTGKWFGFEHDDIVPDILVIGKAIGAGLPVAVVVTTQEVEAKCRGGLLHVQSHQNDPFSAAVARAVLEIIQVNGLVEKAADIGNYFLERLTDLKKETECFEDVRGRGLILGAQLNKDMAIHGRFLAEKCFEKGFIVSFHPASATFRFFPPYIITKEEIDSFIKTLKKLVGTVKIGGC